MDAVAIDAARRVVARDPIKPPEASHPFEKMNP